MLHVRTCIYTCTCMYICIYIVYINVHVCIQCTFTGNIAVQCTQCDATYGADVLGSEPEHKMSCALVQSERCLSCHVVTSSAQLLSLLTPTQPCPRQTCPVLCTMHCGVCMDIHNLMVQRSSCAIMSHVEILALRLYEHAAVYMYMYVARSSFFTTVELL